MVLLQQSLKLLYKLSWLPQVSLSRVAALCQKSFLSLLAPLCWHTKYPPQTHLCCLFSPFPFFNNLHLPIVSNFLSSLIYILNSFSTALLAHTHLQLLSVMVTVAHNYDLSTILYSSSTAIKCGPEFESLRFTGNLITLFHFLLSKKVALTEDLL